MSEEIQKFSEILEELEEGQFNVDASETFQELVKSLRNVCMVSGVKKAKGTVTIGLEVLLDGGAISVTGTIASKHPVKPRGSSIFWATKNNFISNENPKQPSLPFTKIESKKEVVEDFVETKKTVDVAELEKDKLN